MSFFGPINSELKSPLAIQIKRDDRSTEDRKNEIHTIGRRDINILFNTQLKHFVRFDRKIR